MLKTFIRFTPADYTLEEQTECLSETIIPCDEYQTPVLIKAGDVVKWIMNKSEILLNGLELADIKIGLTNCGVLVAQNIGVLTEAGTQIFCQATIPGVIVEGCYEFVLYTPYTTNCTQFNGNTFQQTIDTGTVFGDALTCTFNDFL